MRPAQTAQTVGTAVTVQRLERRSDRTIRADGSGHVDRTTLRTQRPFKPLRRSGRSSRSDVTAVQIAQTVAVVQIAQTVAAVQTAQTAAAAQSRAPGSGQRRELTVRSVVTTIARSRWIVPRRDIAPIGLRSSRTEPDGAGQSRPALGGGAGAGRPSCLDLGLCRTESSIGVASRRLIRGQRGDWRGQALCGACCARGLAGGRAGEVTSRASRGRSFAVDRN